jgi:hypothetical protein
MRLVSERAPAAATINPAATAIHIFIERDLNP